MSAPERSGSERTIYRDPQTGWTIWRLTHSQMADTHTYAAVCPWSSDQAYIVFSTADPRDLTIEHGDQWATNSGQVYVMDTTDYALHKIGITPEDHDVVHAYFVTEFEREYWAMTAGPQYIDALEAIEVLRPPYVRGDAKGGPKAARQAIEHIARLRRKARAARPRKVSGPIALPVCRM